MDIHTATEQAYKHGREAGRAESMNWVSVTDNIVHWMEIKKPSDA